MNNFNTQLNKFATFSKKFNTASTDISVLVYTIVLSLLGFFFDNNILLVSSDPIVMKSLILFTMFFAVYLPFARMWYGEETLSIAIVIYSIGISIDPTSTFALIIMLTTAIFSAVLIIGTFLTGSYKKIQVFDVALANLLITFSIDMNSLSSVLLVCFAIFIFTIATLIQLDKSLNRTSQSDTVNNYTGIFFYIVLLLKKVILR